jgi:hypothetical protein
MFIHKNACNIKLPNGQNAQFFQSYPGILLKNIEASDEIVQYFSDTDIIHTGKSEKYEHGQYKVVIIKAGTKVDIIIMPNNSINVLAPNTRMVIGTGHTVGINIDFDVNAFAAKNSLSNQSKKQ